VAGVSARPGVLVAGGAVGWVETTTGDHRYTAGDVLTAPVALVLGAQVYADGTPSPFLAARSPSPATTAPASTTR
jgi:hypothetical protein